MKFVHKTKHAKKYVYHKFCFEVPELVQLFEKDGEEWIKRENASRQEQIKELRSTKNSWDDEPKTKKELKQDLKELEQRLKTNLKPATLEEWKQSTDATEDFRVTLNKSTGTYELEICKEMTVFDKLKGANSRKNSGVRRWEYVAVSEKVIPDNLPVEPMTKEENAEATEKINWEAR